MCTLEDEPTGPAIFFVVRKTYLPLTTKFNSSVGTMMTKVRIQDIRNGMLASFAATIVLSAIIVMKQLAGMVPQMNPIADLAGIAHSLLGVPAEPLVGWVLHFAIGAFVWGTLFAVLVPKIPGSIAIKGVLFGTGAWLLMMCIFLPMAGQGFFGINGGMVIPAMALMLHLVYGAVLGTVFGMLSVR
jgi:hypothetical protein